MTEFWFIRHGESESNAGLPSLADQTTPLTEKGRHQAAHIPNSITNPPDLFVVSPYIRAIETATPTITKFPQIPQETWPIQEFSYLSYQQYQNTTSKQRGGLSREYFRKADPDLVLGDGGESFHQFMNRIEDCLERISHSSKHKIILFGHGWFMRATLWRLLTNQPDRSNYLEIKERVRKALPSLPLALNLFSFSNAIKMKKMFSFLIFSAGVQIPNGGILKLKSYQNGDIEFIGFDLSHMPDNLVETTWRNR